MPELPEVEVLVRHLAPLLQGRVVRQVVIGRAKVLHPTSPKKLRATLTGARFSGLQRRGKYMIFELRRAGLKTPVRLLGPRNSGLWGEVPGR